jgi:hypothetical protein
MPSAGRGGRQQKIVFYEGRCSGKQHPPPPNTVDWLLFMSMV